MTQHKITVMLFRDTGKFHDEEELDLLPDEIHEGRCALMFKIVPRVRKIKEEWINSGG